jgi:hypothetical protein
VKHADVTIGFVHNARYDSSRKRLIADAWIDVERARTVDPRVEEAISNRQEMEVSTGLFHDTGNIEGGTFNGIEYKLTARRIVPDHLAVLPGGRGACSRDNGCGLLRNEWPPSTTPWITKEQYELVLNAQPEPMTMPSTCDDPAPVPTP